jgi:hypothetical protein
MKLANQDAKPELSPRTRRGKWRKLFFKRVVRRLSQLTDMSETVTKTEEISEQESLSAHQNANIFDFSFVEE